jgi:hypothetical protein
MKLFAMIGSVLALSAMPALAAAPASAQEQVSQPDDNQPVALSDQELDAVQGGDLLNLNLNLSALNALNANVQANLSGLNPGGLLGTPGGLVGNATGLLGGNSPLAGLLNTTSGLLHTLGL